jgi:endonuclease/exonuclease/phosphatase family metal-dependent hydrolase
VDSGIGGVEAMKIVTYNIRYGLGLDDRFDLERIADTVRGADIIGLQEVERFWRRSGMVDQPQQLANLLDEYYWTYYPAFDVDASERRQDNSLLNRRRQFGTMLLSRWPILSSRHIAFPQLRTLNLLNMATGALEGVIASPIGPMQVCTTHLSSISTRERLLQIETLITSLEQFRRAGGVWTLNGKYNDPIEAENFIACDWNNGEAAPSTPEHTLIMGDFNSTEESPEYIRFAGEPDPLYGRGIHQGDLIDSWSVARTKIGNPSTWWPVPADRTPGHPLRLDYCFLNTELASTVSRAWVDEAAMGSDHKPYWIELDT